MVSQKNILYSTHTSYCDVGWWNDCVRRWTAWGGERHGRCDALLGYSWSSDDTSEGGPSASGPQLTVGNSNQGKGNHREGATTVFLWCLLQLSSVHATLVTLASSLFLESAIHVPNLTLLLFLFSLTIMLFPIIRTWLTYLTSFKNLLKCHLFNMPSLIPLLDFIVAVTNYCKISALKQHKFIFHQFYRSEVQHSFHWSKIRVGGELHFL